jgi:hypothetical protein
MGAIPPEEKESNEVYFNGGKRGVHVKTSVKIPQPSGFQAASS